ncbi:MAG: hypothetical protein HN731_01490 [Rhodospirillaceae bacterium]|nr:hypothetical protein [Rhodospirillaceae bacterium]
MPEIRDVDRDAVHTLPLATIPFKTAGLGKTRMIKNSHLQSVIEIFEDDSAGSGQLAVESLHQVYSNIEANDIKLLRSLAKLYSYDVFGLRVQLRNMGIPVNDHDHLKLSSSKQKELAEYMKHFTERLIMEIYGSDDESVKDYGDVLALFRHPDVNLAREKLRIMSQRLGIDIAGVPKFLEDYGDIYLSVAYFRQCMDSVQPAIDDFESSVEEIINHPQLKQNANLVAVSTRLNDKIQNLNKVAHKRFAVFSQSTDDMWDGITAEKFSGFKELVEANHTAIGGILCTLNVKMGAWMAKFPNKDSGGPVKRADFILTDMKQGL